MTDTLTARDRDKQRHRETERQRDRHIPGDTSTCPQACTQVLHRGRPHCRGEHTGREKHIHTEQHTHTDRCTPRGTDPHRWTHLVYTHTGAHRDRETNGHFHQETSIPSQVLRADPTFLALAERQTSTYGDGHPLRCTPALAVRKTSPGTHKDRYRDVTDTKQGLGMLRR